MDPDAVRLYEEAMELLGSADVRPGAEKEAQALLEKAIAKLQGAGSGKDGEKRKRKRGASHKEQATELLAELQFVLGRVVEGSAEMQSALAAYRSAHALVPWRSDINFHFARLLWKCASTDDDMREVEARLREAIVQSDDQEQQRDATELLARLLCQGDQARRAEALVTLRKLGFTYCLAANLTVARTKEEGQIKKELQGSKLAAAEQRPTPVNVFDDVLPGSMFALMREAFALGAPFWSENEYHSPRTGFFSFLHPLPASFPSPDVVFSASSGVGQGLDRVLQHLWVIAARAHPAVKTAKFVEWWAHARPHYYGHQIHFDSVPGSTRGVPHHPIISTVFFVTADCGGPTLITDQTISSAVTTKGWLVEPRANRFMCFDGSLLHCVLPGSGAAPSADARRTTFMAAFWADHPNQGAEFAALFAGRGGNSHSCSFGRKGRKRAPTYRSDDASNCARIQWPHDFSLERLIRHEQNSQASVKASASLNEKDAVIPLGAHEIWEDIGASIAVASASRKAAGGGKRKMKKRQCRPTSSADGAAELDMIGTPGLFTLSESLLGLGMNAVQRRDEGY